MTAPPIKRATHLATRRGRAPVTTPLTRQATRLPHATAKRR